MESPIVTLHDHEEEFEVIKRFTKNFITSMKPYSKLTPGEIFIIVQKSRILGINPLEGLNGGMHSIKGKIEISAELMNRLIRMKGHRITRLDTDDGSCCTLKGIRADTGDEWICSFSKEDAMQAGLWGTGAWKTYPKNMLFARCLSKLARQFFPDCIAGCYIEGEISQDKVAIETPVMKLNSEVFEIESCQEPKMEVIGISHEEDTDIPSQPVPSETVKIDPLLERLGVKCIDDLDESQREMVLLYSQGKLK